MRVVEKTDSKIVMRVMTKCIQVPYCDTFNVEEEFVFASINPKSNCGIVRVTTNVIFYKSTLFKSKI